MPLKRFEEIAEREMGWAVQRVQLEPRHNREDDLIQLVRGLAERSSNQLSRMRKLRSTTTELIVSARSLATVRVDDFTFSLSGVEAERQQELLATLLYVTQVAVKSGRQGFLLLLDEAQVVVDAKDREGEHPLSLLIAAVNILQEREVPIGLVLCGLPTLKSDLLKARTYSEQMFRGEDVGSLSRDEASDALLKPLDGSHRRRLQS